MIALLFWYQANISQIKRTLQSEGRITIINASITLFKQNIY